MKKTYTYNPEKIGEQGVDRMRFELGDTMVEGAEETSALSNEEYTAIIAAKKTWKRAKLAALESIMRRFGMEVNTTVGPLKLEMQSRAEFWRKQYEQLKKECGADTVPTAGKASPESGTDGGHYFYGGMHDNAYAKTGGGERDLLFKFKQHYVFHVMGVGEHIYRLHCFHTIFDIQQLEVTRLCSRITTNIYDPFGFGK